jgi:hypothetical protein
MLRAFHRCGPDIVARAKMFGEDFHVIIGVNGHAIRDVIETMMPAAAR